MTPTGTDSTAQPDAAERAAAASCRSCGADGLVPVLDLGLQPLANRLRTTAELDDEEPRFPLDVAACPECSLVQLTYSVPPEEMFSDYPYFSSVSPSLVAHAKEIAERKVADLGLGPDSLAMEIASNDGYLLQHYRDAGVPVLGVDPARNIARVAEDRGIPTRCAFFGREVAAELVAEGFRPDVVHANNVMAHVPALNSFVAGIATLIGDHGRLVTESPYLKELLDHVEFDTIYHEHLCYYSLTALDRLFARHGLVIEDVERLAIHGGTLRMTVGSEAVCRRGPAVVALLEEEQKWGVDDPSTYAAFGERVRQLGRDLRAMIDSLLADGACVVAYGASAKGSTLLNTFGIGRERLKWVADASPHKQGLHAPGTALPIVGPERLLLDKPDYVLLLAWNFADEIMGQQQAYRDAGGHFIVPVPAPRIA
jgi:C-methyltransferase-like protein/putative zinc binding protein/methyltransferase family protein